MLSVNTPAALSAIERNIISSTKIRDTMVNTIQVNVKLQERRNEALKWELLRQGGCQEKFDSIAQEVSRVRKTLVPYSRQDGDGNDPLFSVCQCSYAQRPECEMRVTSDVCTCVTKQSTHEKKASYGRACGTRTCDTQLSSFGGRHTRGRVVTADSLMLWWCTKQSERRKGDG